MIAKLVCCGGVVGRVYDQGVGDALFVSMTDRYRPVMQGGGRSGQKSDDIWVEVRALLVEQDRRPSTVKTKCKTGHHDVLLTRSALARYVARYRAGTARPKLTIACNLSRAPPHGFDLGHSSDIQV